MNGPRRGRWLALAPERWYAYVGDSGRVDVTRCTRLPRPSGAKPSWRWDASIACWGVPGHILYAHGWKESKESARAAALRGMNALLRRRRKIELDLHRDATSNLATLCEKTLTKARKKKSC